MRILPHNIIFVLFISFFLLSVYSYFNLALDLEYVFSANILNISICFPLSLYIHKKTSGLLNPSLYFSLFFHITHLFFPFIYSSYYSDNGFTNMNYTTNFNEESHIFYILSLAIIFFHIGFNLLKKIKLNKENSTILELDKSIKINKTISFIYLVIVFFRFYQFYMGYRGSTFLTGNNVESVFFIYKVFVFISNYWFLFFGYFSYLFFAKKINKRYFYLIAIIELLIIIFDSNRRLFINFSLTLILTYIYLNKTVFILRFKHIFLFIVSLIIFVLTTIMGFFLANAGTSILNYSELSSYVLNFLSNGESIFNIILVSIITSFNGNVVLSIAMNNFNGDWGPVGIINFFKQITPSFLQNDKYAYSRGYENLFGEFAFSYNVEYSYLSFNQITALFLSYGYWGVIFGMFFIGVLMFVVYKTFLLSNKLSRKIIYLSSFAYFSIYFNSSFIGGDIVFSLRFLVYFLIIEKIVAVFSNYKKKEIL
jgi:hypothetical protein